MEDDTVFTGGIIVICVLLVASIIFGLATKQPELPPKPVVKDIVRVVRVMTPNVYYDLMTVEENKTVIVRRRAFERIAADAPDDALPWAEIKNPDRSRGEGNILHIHSPREIEFQSGSSTDQKVISAEIEVRDHK